MFISDQNVNVKSSRNKTCIFHSLRNPKGRTLDYFFYVLHIRHNYPRKLIPISMSYFFILLKLSMETVQQHLIVGPTLGRTCILLQVFKVLNGV